MTWTGVELYTGTVCACLPSLKPLLNLILHGSVRPGSQKSNESDAQTILEIAEATKRRNRQPSDANVSSAYVFALMRGAMDPHMFEQLSEIEAGSAQESAPGIEMESIGKTSKESR
ncbi:hypothetical protein ACHAQJ_009762 [Trichoderma viride]